MYGQTGKEESLQYDRKKYLSSEDDIKAKRHICCSVLWIFLRKAIFISRQNKHRNTLKQNKLGLLFWRKEYKGVSVGKWRTNKFIAELRFASRKK